MPTLDAIGIVTSNMARSVQFYRLLGVNAPDATDDHIEATLANGLRLMWDDLELVRQIHPDWQTPVGQRLGLAFLCGSPGEVDSVHQRLMAEGFASAKEPWDAFWGQRYAQVLDPDGNIVDLFASLE